MEREFPLEDVISVLSAETGRPVRRSDEEVPGTYDLCEFLLGERPTRRTIPAAWKDAKVKILQQHPWLDPDFGDTLAPPHSSAAWVEQKAAELGGTIMLRNDS